MLTRLQHFGPIVAERDSLRVVECQTCGFAHLDPPPDPLQLVRYYSSEFWQREKVGWLERYELQAGWDALRWSDWLLVAGGLIAGRNLLDLGAGYGGWVAAAEEHGWDAIGWEPSESAVDYARTHGRPVYAQSWTPDTECGLQDCISALWLIEHLPDPLAFLRWCHGHLTDGGLLILAAPNEFNLWQLSANLHARIHDYFVHHTHANYFTQASLANLLGRAGFQIVDRLATWPMEKFILDGKDYTADATIGDACHAEVRESDLELDRAQRLATYRVLARSGIGRDQIIFARAE